MTATKTISFYGEEADCIIATLSQKDMEIRSLRKQLASRDAEIARLKTVPMRYRRMAFNAQLQDEVTMLEQENDQLREQVKMLRDVLQFYMDNGICEPLYHKAKEALAATDDHHE